MEIKPRFEVMYLEEVNSFLQSLPVKVRAKIQYNIMVAQHENDPELFKKLMMTFGNSAHASMEWHIACLPFGTKTYEQWWWLRTGSLRKHKRHRRMRYAKPKQ